MVDRGSAKTELFTGFARTHTCVLHVILTACLKRKLHAGPVLTITC